VSGYDQMAFGDFIEALASSDPTPGGGTASAASGAMGAALAAMVVSLTLSREKYAASHDAVRPIGESARQAASGFLRLLEADSEAYQRVVAARKRPKDDPERVDAIERAGRRATEVPLETARLAVDLLSRLPELAAKGNPNAASDAGVAALLLAACAEGALMNVGINLSGIRDAEFVGTMEKEMADLSPAIERLRDQVVGLVRKTFKS
jgi:methenyltetrahydrofolate cyclohydrolase